MKPRRTLNLSDETWRAVRLRSISDDRTASEVVEAAIQTTVIAGGPIIYGDTPEAWRTRHIHEWVGGTEYGKAAQIRFAEELEADPNA